MRGRRPALLFIKKKRRSSSLLLLHRRKKCSRLVVPPKSEHACQGKWCISVSEEREKLRRERET